jgi:hypothetical protein
MLQISENTPSPLGTSVNKGKTLLGPAKVAEPFHRLIPLDLSGDDSCGGAHAVGNACDALGCLGVYSVSCVYYNVDAALLLSSFHPLYQVRHDQTRLNQLTLAP